jgi:hypothetical protein
MQGNDRKLSPEEQAHEDLKRRPGTVLRFSDREYVVSPNGKQVRRAINGEPAIRVRGKAARRREKKQRREARQQLDRAIQQQLEEERATAAAREYYRQIDGEPQL